MLPLPEYPITGVNLCEGRNNMAHKLVQGDKLPDITINLIDGRSLDLPRDMTGRYLVLLFYRGNW